VFAHYLARNNEEREGIKCKVCLQQLGKNQEYCQTCLPTKINRKEHNNLKGHEFKTLKTANSHIYSAGVLLCACGGNHRDILKVSRTPKPITPNACYWHLPECTSCDSSTADLEKTFKQRYETLYAQPSLVDSDAVLFHIYIHRGLAVNVNLMHYLFCNNCRQYLPGIRNVLKLAWEFRRAILQNRSKDVPEDKRRQGNIDIESKAVENLLFHAIDVFPDENYRIEFPFVCDVDSCALVYAQIPPCCWAVPLDPSSPALPVLRENFRDVVERINRKLSVEREQYLKSIGLEGTSYKLIVKYLPECCLSVN